MIYQAALARSGQPIWSTACSDILDNVDNDFPVEERIGQISTEWLQDWWLKKLDKMSARPETMQVFGSVADDRDVEEAEDLYE